MANLIIKPTSGGSLVLQDEGGYAALTVGTSGATTLTNQVFATGHIIQTIGDTYAPSSSVNVTTTASRVLSTNLEVAITCNSTSNYLLLNAFIPNWTNRAVQNAALKYGFQYSTDNWSSEVKLGTTYINTAEGYSAVASSNTFQMSIHPFLWVQVPTVSAMKVQLEFGSDSGTTSLFWNANTDQQVASFVIQEVQQ